MNAPSQTEPGIKVYGLEPIRFVGAVQPHGAILVIDPLTQSIVAASESCSEMLGTSASALLGSSARAILGQETADALLSVQSIPGRPSPPLPLSTRTHVACARTNETGLVLVDIEEVGTDATLIEREFRYALSQLRQLGDLVAIAGAACQTVRRTMGFDRVMVWRFDADWHAEVIAEARAEQLEALLGLQFKATDIPKQERELYRLCRVRQVPDVGHTASALLALPAVGPVDLSPSVLRSVSPVYIDYCRRMGVQATLVGSLVVDGRLWGLVACHHGAGPRYAGPEARDAFAGFCEGIAGRIEIDALRERGAFSRTILDSSPNPMCVLDANATIVIVNRAWEGFAKANGASAETAAPLGIDYRAICAAAVGKPRGDEAAAAWQGISDVLDGRKDFFALEYPCDSPSQRRWFEMSVCPMQPPCEGAVVLHTDISARKLALLALEASEHRYLEVLEAQTDLICRFKADGTILYANPSFCSFFGQSREALTGHRWQPAVLAADLPKIEAALSRLSPEHPVVTVENRVDARDGQLRWGEFVNRAFFDEDRHLVEIQVVGRDITDRKAAENRIETLLQEQDALLNSPVVGIVKVVDRHVAWANHAFASMFGYAVEEVIGQPSRIFFTSDTDYADFTAASNKVLTAGGVFQAEALQCRKDGSRYWVAFSSALLDLATNTQIRALVDITARKEAVTELERHRQQLEELVATRTHSLQQAKESVEASLAQLQQAHDLVAAGKSTLDAALESMSDAVFIANREGSFIDFNEAFATFHRFPDKASCPLTLAEYPALLDVSLPSGESLPYENWPVPRALRGESAFNVEFTMRRRDTRESWIGSFNCAPIRGKGGSILGAVVTARDVTEEKHRKLALSQAKEAAEAANRAKSAFLATMSHELRTPLNGIMGMVELAQRRASDPRQIDQLAKALKASQHLLEIIRDILDISRIEADRFSLVEADFQLDTVLHNLDALIRQQIAKAQLELSIELAPELLGMVVRGDARRLSQVLLNLTSNAAKFTTQGSITVRALLLEDSPARVVLRFEVQDTGIGIAPEDQGRIFQSFEQVDSSHTRPYGGSGLGLAISKRLVQMMQGTIGVDSALGAGATFWFTVQLGKPRQDVDVAPVQQQPSARELLKSRHRGAYVLLVEDDAMNLEVAQGLLEDCGLVVHSAPDGAQAVETAQRVNYDLILMDIQMPVMDGMEATRRIRGLPNNPQVPIIAFTANVFPEDEARCREAGMNAFLGRPIASEALYAAMLDWLAYPRASARDPKALSAG